MWLTLDILGVNKAIKVEKHILSLKNGLGANEKKASMTVLVKKEYKDKDSLDMDGMHRLITKLSNVINDIKKHFREGKKIY